MMKMLNRRYMVYTYAPLLYYVHTSLFHVYAPLMVWLQQNVICKWLNVIYRYLYSIVSLLKSMCIMFNMFCVSLKCAIFFICVWHYIHIVPLDHYIIMFVLLHNLISKCILMRFTRNQFVWRNQCHSITMV